MKVTLFEPPARTSNEYELWRAMPSSTLTVVSDRDGWGADNEIVLPVLRAPVVGGHERWAMAWAWLRSIGDSDLGDPDLIASLELYSVTTSQARRAARSRGLPHVIAVAESLASNPLYRFPPYRQITAASVSDADLVIAITERARDHAIELGTPPERTAVVHLGVDTDEFTPAPSLEASPVVVVIAQLRADRGTDKGIQETITACRSLLDTHPDLRLRLIGDGPLRAELTELAAGERFLEVVGPIDRSEIADQLRQARVLVLASKDCWKWEEQFGFAAVEAMACGLPVVVSKSGALPEVVGPANAVVDSSDPSAIAEGIADALGPKGDEIGAANRARVLDQFDNTAQAELLEGTLRGVL